MSKNEKVDAPIELAAGGIVHRSDHDGLKIAIVRRERHGGDWSLPKGHVDKGENWEVAAVREVREETGCEAEICGEARSTSYLVEDIPKLVLFFPMKFVAETGALDAREVTEVAWLSPAEAVSQLTHGDQRELVEDLFLRGRRRRQSWLKRMWLQRSASPQRQRLEDTLAAFELELWCKALHPESDEWHDCACRVLSCSRDAAEMGYVDRAWRLFHLARRLTVMGMAESRRRAEGIALVAEAESKLSDWRQETVVTSLKDTLKAKKVPSASELFHATEILHGHFDNVYHKLALFRGRLAWLFASLVACLFLLSRFPAAEDSGTTVLSDSSRFWLIASLGLVGAVLSAALNAMRGEGRIPKVVWQGLQSLIRPAVGAVSAIIVVIVGESGITGSFQATGSMAYALAVAAGFSERLVSRAMNAVDAASERPSPAKVKK